MILCTLPGP